MLRILLLFLFISSTIVTYSQEIDIVPFLKQIESGEIEAANNSVKQLMTRYPSDPSVLFLDAVLTKNGVEALRKYIKIYDNYPQSKYADASLYRMFSYYYALGYYKKAENYLDKLKFEYPSSPYIKAADRNIPEQVGVFYEDTLGTSKSSDDSEAKSLPVLKPESNDAKFTVQAGAFLNKNNAEALKRKLETDGYRVYLVSKNIGGSLLNVITVGEFTLEADAQPIISHLSEKYKLQGRIVSIN